MRRHRLFDRSESGHGESVVTLMGNHEAMALAAVDGSGPVRLWLAQGGLATLESYGVAEPRELPRPMSIGCARCP